MTVNFPNTLVNNRLTSAVISGGPSAAMAVLINDTNPADAQWIPFSSVPYVLLGTTDGTYQVMFGFLGSDGQMNWVSTNIIMDATPPAMVPAGGSWTTNSPLLQLTGYATEALSAISFDVVNSQTTNLNQNGFVVASDGNTFAGAVSTNWFQCFDIRLAPGLNTITVRYADLAGNVATNVYSCTLDTASMTAPTLSVDWPADGTIVSGNNTTIKGHVSDPTATMVAQVAQNGVTNSFTGVVERDGTFWIDNVALAGATNAITITATDLAGNSSATALTVQTSPVNLTVDPMGGDALKGNTATVSGTIDAGGYTVTVNGAAAVVWTNGDGSIHWQATNAPVPAGGVATFRIQAVNNGDPEMLAVFDKPSFIRVSTYRERINIDKHQHAFVVTPPCDAYDLAKGVPYSDLYHIFTLQRQRAWDHGVGGSSSADCYQEDDGYWAGTDSIQGPEQVDFAWPPESWPPGVVPPSAATFTGTNMNAWMELFTFVQLIPWEHFEYGSDTANPLDECGAYVVYHRTAQTRLQLVAGGRAMPGTQMTVLLKARAAAFSHLTNLLDAVGGPYPLENSTNYVGDATVSATNITVAGVACTDGGDGTNGLVVVTVPAGAEGVDITPLVNHTPYDCYTFAMTNFTLGVAADNNRDGQISFDGSDDTTPDGPYRFWINDSQESGDIASGADSQIPGLVFDGFYNNAPNYAYSHVQGRSDLVNFFPVALNLGNILQQCPLTNGYEYHLSQADNAVKFVYTSLTQGNAFDYLTDVTATNGYGVNGDEAVPAADTIPVPGSSVNLATNWLAAVQTNGGVGILLVEGSAATTQPLNLEIWHNGQKLGGVPMYLDISGVEQMYRHLNLRDGADAPANLPGPAYSGDTGIASSMGEPANLPDSLLDSKWLIFVHGYNVSAQNSRGWESEMFKRFYWSHSRSKFVGVDWLGNPNGGYLVSGSPFHVPDYYLAEMNAFATAPALATKINALPGSKTIVGHSLGCGVTAMALNDYGLQVNHACLVDAAFASECFDGDAAENLADMAYSPWTQDSDPNTPNYPRSLWASDWYKLFQGGSDARQTLTWKNRFTNAIPVVFSFYSSTEDVLGAWPGTPTSTVIQSAFDGFGSYAWVTQEKSKGNMVNLFGAEVVGTDYGGWGFNPCDGYLTNYPVWYKLTSGGLREMKTPTDIGTVTQDLLNGSEYNPLFKNGWGTYNGNNPSEIYVNVDASQFTGPNWILGLYQPNQGSTVASDPAKNAQLLAQAIPALSLPVGANPCLNNSLLGKQFNMPIQYADPNSWPRGKDQFTGIPVWHHSDLDQVAYPYTWKLFNQIITVANQ